MGEDMVKAFKFFDKDDCVKAVVLTGNVRKFCTGADLNLGLTTTAGATVNNS